MFLALFGHRPRQFNELRHFETHFVFDDFDQRDIGCPKVADIGNERTTHGASAGIELAHAPRYQIHQNVGVSNLLQCLFRQFSVQNAFPKIKVERDKIAA